MTTRTRRTSHIGPMSARSADIPHYLPEKVDLTDCGHRITNASTEGRYIQAAAWVTPLRPGSDAAYRLPSLIAGRQVLHDKDDTEDWQALQSAPMTLGELLRTVHAKAREVETSNLPLVEVTPIEPSCSSMAGMESADDASTLTQCNTTAREASAVTAVGGA